MQIRQTILLLAIALVMASCTSGPNGKPISYPTYDPFLPMQTENAFSGGDNVDLAIGPTRTPGPTPTRAPLTVAIRPRDPNAPLMTPTPDVPHGLPTRRTNSQQYTVLAGDTLASIAQAYGISVDALEQANDLSNTSVLGIGQSLNIPPPPAG